MFKKIITIILCIVFPLPLLAATYMVKYHGNVKTHKFHNSFCSEYYNKYSFVPFKSVREAKMAGYKACKKCSKYNK